MSVLELTSNHYSFHQKQFCKCVTTSSLCHYSSDCNFRCHHLQNKASIKNIKLIIAKMFYFIFSEQLRTKRALVNSNITLNAFWAKACLTKLKWKEVNCFRNEAEIQLRGICFLLNVQITYTNTKMKMD